MTVYTQKKRGLNLGTFFAENPLNPSYVIVFFINLILHQKYTEMGKVGKLAFFLPDF